MKYPIRDQTHVSETASFKRLEQCIPDHWIVRYASERDYGIDVLVEPVTHPGGGVKGDLMALQVKGTASLDWNKDIGTDDRRTTFSGIKVSTINYWMGLPVPVFLCVHDEASRALYVAPVKQQVRQRYKELKSQGSFGFELWSKLDLATPHAHVLLMALYFRELRYPYFASALTDLVTNRDLYVEYIESNLGRDVFMEVETPEVLRLFTLYRNVQTVAAATGLEWKVPSLQEFVQRDRELFKEKYVLLHEQTQDQALRALAPLFVSALENGCVVIEKRERDYWAEREFLLSQYVTQRGADAWVKEIKTRLEPLLTSPSG